MSMLDKTRNPKLPSSSSRFACIASLSAPLRVLLAAVLASTALASTAIMAWSPVPSDDITAAGVWPGGDPGTVSNHAGIQALAPQEFLAVGLREPTGVGVAPDGRVYFADERAGSIFEISGVGDRPRLLVSGLKRPRGLIWEGPESLLLVAERLEPVRGRPNHDTDDRPDLRGLLLRHNRSTGLLTVLAHGLKHPRGLARASDGTVFVSAEGLVRANEPDAGDDADDDDDEHGDDDDDGRRSISPGTIFRWTEATGFQVVVTGFEHPDGVVVRSDATLLVAAEQFSASGVRLDGSVFSVDGAGNVAVYVAQRLKRPSGLAIDALEAVFIAAQRAQPREEQPRGIVLKVTRAGASVDFATGLAKPGSLVLSADGHLIATDAKAGVVVRFRAPDRPSLNLSGTVASNQDPFQLRGSAAPGSQLAVVGGREPITALVDSRPFEVDVPMRPNQRNLLQAFAIGASGNALASGAATLAVIHDNIGPTIAASLDPAANAAGWHGSRVRVVFSCADALSGVAMCEPQIELAAEGARQAITGAARDLAGNIAATTVLVSIDGTAPLVTTTVAPAPNAAGWHNSDVTVTFACDDALSGVADCPAARLLASEGAAQTIAATATDVAGNTAIATASISLDKSPPIVQITSPRDGDTLAASPVLVEGSVTDSLAGVAVATITCNGDPALIADSRFTCIQPLKEGANLIVVEATDLADNRGSRRVAIGLTSTPPPSGLPPDPSTVAPLLNGTAVTPFFTATEFLYTGAHPIQTGVAPGTIEPHRAGVIRGTVSTREGAPLQGVRITIHGHDELGSTLSRSDGMFDLAVNGGGQVTIQYKKDEFLPAQRQVQVPWADFAFVPDVALVQLDPEVTVVDLAPGAPTVARGRVVTDTDGTRQATLIFSERGTMANMELPDGTVLRAQGRMHIRMTEYTVGANGRRAMPADLPPTSGYTYAFKVTTDEALAAGARTITFDPPIPYYVENFLDFPVGGIAPFGFYDPEKAAWVPLPNGRIVRILAVNGGVADLDVDGSGQAANATALANLGVTDGERRQLAGLYSPNQSLWRVPLGHFSSGDVNWPYGPPPDAVAPSSPPPHNNDSVEGGDCGKGSIIECQNQVLRETVRLTGTAMTLNYRSDRVPGRRSAYSVTIPLSGINVPASLKRIELQVDVAGRHYTQAFQAVADQHTSFMWDGKDVYGRIVQGERPIKVRIGYVYPAVYLQPSEVSRAFSVLSASGLPISANMPRLEVTLWEDWQGSIGAWDARAIGVGGWTLSTHHAYDPAGKNVHLGNGERRAARNVPDIITTAAGNGFCFSGPCGDGGPATSAGLAVADNVAVGPDGSLYIPMRDGSRIRRVAPDGIITTVAGSNLGSAPGFSGDGGPATSARLSGPHGVAVGPDGSLYIADTGNGRVRRVGLDGIIRTVAGNGAAGFIGFPNPHGNGGPATEAQVDEPRWITVGPDTSLYIADTNNNRIRKVGPDGVITTFAGLGVFERCSPGTACGDGGPATQATFFSPKGIALGPDGSLYVADGLAGRIRRIAPDGRITTVAGRLSGEKGFKGDGGPAVDALFDNLRSVAVASDGSLFVADNLNFRVRRIAPDGTITSVAGSGSATISGDSGVATQAGLYTVDDAQVGPDGALYIWGSNSSRVRRVAPVLPGFTAGDLVITAEDGSEVYVFDNSGRHLRTLHALTGASLYDFRYDAGGRLEAVTDGDGNITTIQRDGLGDPVAIVAPFGQRTALGLDAEGYLAGIMNPAAESVRLTSTSDGLLTSLTNGRGDTTRFDYDVLGRLTLDTDAAGGSQSLGRLDVDRTYSVALKTALGRTTTYRVENLPAGAERRINTLPDGLQTEVVTGADGTRNDRSSDGTAAAVAIGPDPRWGLLAPIATTSTTTPAGLRTVVSTTRTVSLADSNNPLSLVGQNETVSINGRTYTSAFAWASRTFTDKTPLGRQRTMTIDAQGRPVHLQVAGLHAVTRTYDGRGRLATVTEGSGVDARTMTFSYGSDGLVQTIIDPLGRTVSFAHDAAGRVTTKTLTDGRLTDYYYDSNGTLMTITPPGRPAHGFSFTPVNLMSSYDPPNVGAGTNRTLYTYNADQQLTLVSRPDGQTIDLGYDTSGRLNAQTIARGMFSYSYDAPTGNPATITSPGGIRLAYTYDGSLQTSTAWTGGVSGSVARTYDNDFRVTALTVGGTSIPFFYDNDSLLIQAGTFALSRSAQNGLLTGTTLGSATDTWTYNGFGEPTGYRAVFGGATVFTEQFTRDKIARITHKTETMGGITESYGYSYDLAGRLAGVTRNAVATATYTYDTNGNRLTVTKAGGTITANYDNQDRLHQYGAATYTYTANGELHSKAVGGQTTTYQYDALGNLVAVTLPSGPLITYLVDGHNRRIGKHANGALTQGFLYQDALKPIAELDGGNSIVSRFVYATRSNAPDYMIKGGVTYRILTDQLGSPRLVIDITTGTVAQRMDYDEFGQVLNDTNPGFQPFGFAGGLYDRDTGLVRFGLRDYDAETGRWTAKDPTLFATSETNLYSYVHDDPINYIDPDGRDPVNAERACKNVPDIDGVKAQARRAITDKPLRDCVIKQVDDIKLICDKFVRAECKRVKGLGGSCNLGGVNAPTKEVSWCGRDEQAYCLEQTLVHELAHSCGWDHGQGKGVPGDSGGLECRPKVP